MGRGKKGNKKKAEEPPSLTSLSVSESQPSTSEAPSDGTSEEIGLTRGARKKEPKKKPEPATVEKILEPPVRIPEPSELIPEPSAPIPEPVSKEAPAPVPKTEEEEDGGLGLGLGGGKKRSRPKKKSAAALAASQSATQIAHGPSTSTPTTPSTATTLVPSISEPTQISQKKPAPSPWSAKPSHPAPELWTGPTPGQEEVKSFPQEGVGRGRGRGQANRGLLGQQRPVPSSLQVISDAPASSYQQPLSRFKIPDKVLGNRAPADHIRVITNYLPMKIKEMKIYRYDVSFKPDKPKKMLAKAYGLAKQQFFPNEIIAFDQMKNCYALKALPKVPIEERLATTVELFDNNGKSMKFEVSFKATGIIDFGTVLRHMSNGGSSLNPPGEAIQAIDVILRQGTLESYIKAGRQFFKRPSRPVDLGDGLEMWTGLFQSAIFTSRCFINIDVAHKGFPKQQSLIEALTRDFRLRTDTPILQQRGRGVESFQQFVRNLRVMASVGGDSSRSGQKREYICNGLVDPPNRLTFTLNTNDGKRETMTVAEYFQREKKVRLQFPNLNCMWVGPKDRNIFYPMELLTVVYGQALNKQLNDMQLSTMVREAATPPDQRKRKIEEVIRDMNYSRNPYFKKFGLEISDKFFEVEAKVLHPPTLEVGPNRTEIPRNGVWQANGLLKPEALRTWGFLAIETDPDSCDYENMIKLIMNMGRQLGMAVADPMMKAFAVRMHDLNKYLFNALDKQINFLFVIVSGRGRDYYHRVKRMAELDVGILTQCVKENTLARRMNAQTVKNILLKVNSKLMGVNQALDRRCMPNCIKDGGVMIVGADVTHPSPDQLSVPSIAAVTASIDTKCFMYNIELSIQTPKKEMIVEFEEMMVEHLKVYQERQRGALPKKIFVFRDGVSEGQFDQVMSSELQAVHNAYQRRSGKPQRPEVLFLIVQKRHHTRLFSGENNPRNVQPGTVVDKDIVHPKELDFYMVSHQAIKGTARPTRYHAVCNDGNIPSDEVEQLTYYLCHLYSRCMRAVSYPTPTYYAHLACLRARSLTHGEKFDNQELERRPQRLRVLEKMLKFSRMFYV